MPESKFTPSQAEELAAAFAKEGVDYLFIGWSRAILLGVRRLELFRVEYARRHQA